MIYCINVDGTVSVLSTTDAAMCQSVNHDGSIDVIKSKLNSLFND